MTRTIVVGLGRSGLGAARLLKQQNRDVVVFERGDNEALQHTSKTLAEEGIQVVLGQPPNLSDPGQRQSCVSSRGLKFGNAVPTGEVGDTGFEPVTPTMSM